MQRILFVCTGNTCRSPMAAGLFAKILQEKGVTGVEITSAGLVAVDGAPASAEAIEAMRRAGVDLTGHRARRLTREMALAADLVLTMTRRQKEAVLALAPEAGEKIFTLTELAGRIAAGTAGGREGDPKTQGAEAMKQQKKTMVQEDLLDLLGWDLKHISPLARQIERWLCYRLLT